MRILFLVHEHHHDQFMYLLFCAKFSKHLNINKNDFVFTLVLHFHVCLKHSDWCLTDFNENLLKSHATSLQLSITHYNSVKLKTTQNISKKLKTSQNISYHLWQNCTACKAHLKQVTSLHLVIDIMLSCWVVHQVRPVFCRGLKPLVFRGVNPSSQNSRDKARHEICTALRLRSFTNVCQQSSGSTSNSRHTFENKLMEKKHCVVDKSISNSKNTTPVSGGRWIGKEFSWKKI